MRWEVGHLALGGAKERLLGKNTKDLYFGGTKAGGL
jgi:hypothetical protein